MKSDRRTVAPSTNKSKQKVLAVNEYRNGIFQGNTVNGIRSGLGLYLWDSGEFFFGEWINDKIQGEGVLFFSNGGQIQGNFANGKVNGFANLELPNGEIYRGFWKNGKLNGKCFKYFPNKKQWLTCEYKEGLLRAIDSQGYSALPKAEMNKNKLNSLEKLTRRHFKKECFGYEMKSISFNDGGKYLGVVKNNIPNGLGIFHYTDKKTDLGFYKHGVLHGLGRLCFSNGDRYDGMLSEGKFEGIGWFYHLESNRWIHGIFENNYCKIIENKGQGTFDSIICFVKAEQHRASKNFIDKSTSLNLFTFINADSPSCDIQSPNRLLSPHKYESLSPPPRPMAVCFKNFGSQDMRAKTEPDDYQKESQSCLNSSKEEPTCPNSGTFPSTNTSNIIAKNNQNTSDLSSFLMTETTVMRHMELLAHAPKIECIKEVNESNVCSKVKTPENSSDGSVEIKNSRNFLSVDFLALKDEEKKEENINMTSASNFYASESKLITPLVSQIKLAVSTDITKSYVNPNNSIDQEENSIDRQQSSKLPGPKSSIQIGDYERANYSVSTSNLGNLKSMSRGRRNSEKELINAGLLESDHSNFSYNYAAHCISPHNTREEVLSKSPPQYQEIGQSKSPLGDVMNKLNQASPNLLEPKFTVLEEKSQRISDTIQQIKQQLEAEMMNKKKLLEKLREENPQYYNEFLEKKVHIFHSNQKPEIENRQPLAFSKPFQVMKTSLDSRDIGSNVNRKVSNFDFENGLTPPSFFEKIKAWGDEIKHCKLSNNLAPQGRGTRVSVANNDVTSNYHNWTFEEVITKIANNSAINFEGMSHSIDKNLKSPISAVNDPFRRETINTLNGSYDQDNTNYSINRYSVGEEFKEGTTVDFRIYEPKFAGANKLVDNQQKKEIFVPKFNKASFSELDH